MRPLLGTMIECRELLGVSPKAEGNEHYREYLSALCHLHEQFGESWYPVDSVLHNCCQKAYHLDFEIIRAERYAHDMTQEMVADEVYGIPYAKAADDVNCVPQRYDAATKVAQNTLRLISQMGTSNASTTSYSNYLRANMSVFNLAGNGYENYFKLADFSRYANEVCNISGLFKNTNTWNAFFNDISAVPEN